MFCVCARKRHCREWVQIGLTNVTLHQSVCHVCVPDGNCLLRKIMTIKERSPFHKTHRGHSNLCNQMQDMTEQKNESIYYIIISRRMGTKYYFRRISQTQPPLLRASPARHLQFALPYGSNLHCSAFGAPEHCQCSSHMYRGTPPICCLSHGMPPIYTAIFLRKYWCLGSPVCSPLLNPTGVHTYNQSLVTHFPNCTRHMLRRVTTQFLLRV